MRGWWNSLPQFVIPLERKGDKGDRLELGAALTTLPSRRAAAGKPAEPLDDERLRGH